MTINEIAAAKNEVTSGAFGTDFAGFYDLSKAEADRIAFVSKSLDEFEDIWANEDWWKDA